MTETLDVLLSGGVGLVAGVLGALGKSFFDRRNQVDAGLRAKRAELYVELWKLTGLLPLHPRDDDVTYADLAARSDKLRAWYFDRSGGLYLSRASQRLYIAFQKRLCDLHAQAGDRRLQPLDAADYDLARLAASTLRSSLTDDLHSRSGSRDF